MAAPARGRAIRAGVAALAPDYPADMPPGMLPTGTGVGLTLPTWSARRSRRSRRTGSRPARGSSRWPARSASCSASRSWSPSSARTPRATAPAGLPAGHRRAGRRPAAAAALALLLLVWAAAANGGLQAAAGRRPRERGVAVRRGNDRRASTSLSQMSVSGTWPALVDHDCRGDELIPAEPSRSASTGRAGSSPSPDPPSRRALRHRPRRCPCGLAQLGCGRHTNSAAHTMTATRIPVPSPICPPALRCRPRYRSVLA